MYRNLFKFIFSTIRNNFRKKKQQQVLDWLIINNGILKGRKLLLEKDSTAYTQMLNGDHDKFLIEYCKKYDFNNKTMIDIGAHIGFNSLCFAEMVGENGKVISFEPNQFNCERFKLIMSKNNDISNRINLYEISLSDKEGLNKMFLSDQIDNGRSSGGFIKGVRPLNDSRHKLSAFQEYESITTTLDNFLSKNNYNQIKLIKIDVEGAESLVLAGSRNLLKVIKPILFIEIHSVVEMCKVVQILNEFNYKIEILDEGRADRCHILAA